jgi:hypothetical protein
VYLENVDTGTHTDKKRIDVGVRSAAFESAEVRTIAASRTYRSTNRIRAVVEWSTNRSASPTVDLRVGIEVQLLLFGRLITPTGKSRTIHTLLATIDESTEGFPPNYCFTTDFVAWGGSAPLVAPLRSCESDGEVTLPKASENPKEKSKFIVIRSIGNLPGKISQRRGDPFRGTSRLRCSPIPR